MIEVFGGWKEERKVAAGRVIARQEEDQGVTLSEKTRGAVLKFSCKVPKENEEKPTKLGNSGSH